MKKILIPLLLIATTLVFFTGCKKENDRPEKKSKEVTLNVTVKAGTAYELDVSAYGDDDDIATIVTQAAAFDVSEITKNTASRYIYKYLVNSGAKTNSITSDKVILKLYEPPGRRCYYETVITVNFTIQ